MAEVPQPDNIVRVLLQRADILSEITNGPKTQSELVQRTENSQATVYRAVIKLQDLNIIAETENGYVFTDFGKRIHDDYNIYLDEIENSYAVRKAISYFPDDIKNTLLSIDDGEAFFNEGMSIGSATAPNKNLVQEANEVHTVLDGFMPSYLTAHIDPTRYADQRVEMILPNDIVNYVISQSEQELLELYDTDNFTLYRATSPIEYSTTIVDLNNRVYAILLIHSSGSVDCSIRTESTSVVEWARNRFEAVRTDAKEVRLDDELYQSKSN